MKKTTSNRRGFGPVKILLTFVAVVIVGFIVLFLISLKGRPLTTDTTNTSGDSQTGINNGTGGETKYLEIKEWGVKFALTTDTADAYYDTKTASPLDSMSLRVHSLDTESDCANSPQSIAAIFRVQKDATDDSVSGQKYSVTRDGQVIGDYFYFIQGSQYSCTDNTNKQIILQGVRNSFNTAGPTIQEIGPRRL